MGKAIVAVFFIAGFIIFSIIKYAVKGTKQAYQAVNENHSYSDSLPAISPRKTEGKAGKIIEVTSGVLMLQRMLISQDSGPLEDRAVDRWSLGYVGGFVDAMLQRNGIGADEEGFTVLLTVFMVLFGDTEGRGYTNRFLDLQDDPELNKGMMRGGNECVHWMDDSKGNPNPMGWASHVFDYRKIGSDETTVG